MPPLAPAQFPIHKAIVSLRKLSRRWRNTTIADIAERTEDPFRILIATVLSARTKDETTARASERLFRMAPTPRRMSRLSPRTIAKAIYPVGFYRTKARNIAALCRTLLVRFGGKVPDTLEELVTLAGVGRKTANLVLTAGFRKHGICVDTHVHRISNRWGLVRTKTPKETEFTLYQVLPKKFWIPYNDLLVAFGQNLCRPISPLCSQCPLEPHCPKTGVRRHR